MLNIEKIFDNTHNMFSLNQTWDDSMKVFTEHPASVGENYFQHMGTSFSFGAKMFMNSFACFAHGIFPFICTSRGSQAISDLHDRMVAHRHRDCEDTKASAMLELAE